MSIININKSAVSKKIGKVAIIKSKKRILPIISNQVNISNKQLVQQFLSHAISREISQKSTASSSKLGYGNLFTFLGFNNSQDPVGELANFLSNSIKIKNLRINSNYQISISIEIPELDDMDQIAQLPWINKSFAKAIERGVSGLGNYLYSEKGFKKSRSGKGIQLEKNISGRSFKPTPYISKIIENTSKQLVKEILSII